MQFELLATGEDVLKRPAASGASRRTNFLPALKFSRLFAARTDPGSLRCQRARRSLGSSDAVSFGGTRQAVQVASR